jgi:hypothetical protein
VGLSEIRKAKYGIPAADDPPVQVITTRGAVPSSPVVTCTCGDTHSTVVGAANDAGANNVVSKDTDMAPKRVPIDLDMVYLLSGSVALQTLTGYLLSPLRNAA